LLLAEDKKTNTHAGIIANFEEVFASKIDLEMPFTQFIYQLQNNEPTIEFAQKYLIDSQSFYKKADEYRINTLVDEK